MLVSLARRFLNGEAVGRLATATSPAFVSKGERKRERPQRHQLREAGRVAAGPASSGYALQELLLQTRGRKYSCDAWTPSKQERGAAAGGRDLLPGARRYRNNSEKWGDVVACHDWDQ